MTAYPEFLHTDGDGVKTSAKYVAGQWVLPVESSVVDGGHPTIGAKADTAVTDPTVSGSVVAVLKGILTFLRVSPTGLGKAEDAAHVSGDTGVMGLAVRRDTAAASSGTTGDYEPLQTDAVGRLRVTGPHLEDAVAGDGDAGFPLLVVRRDTAATDAGTTGDYSRLAVDAVGRLRTVTKDEATDATNTTSTALAASLVVKASAGKLWGLQGHIAAAAGAGFVHIFDAATATGTPKIIIPIAAGGGKFSLDFGRKGRAHATGITVGFSSTETTYTSGGAHLWADAQID